MKRMKYALENFRGGMRAIRALSVLALVLALLLCAPAGAYADGGDGTQPPAAGDPAGQPPAGNSGEQTGGAGAQLPAGGSGEQTGGAGAQLPAGNSEELTGGTGAQLPAGGSGEQTGGAGAQLPAGGSGEQTGGAGAQLPAGGSGEQTGGEGAQPPAGGSGEQTGGEGAQPPAGGSGEQTGGAGAQPPAGGSGEQTGGEGAQLPAGGSGEQTGGAPAAAPAAANGQSEALTRSNGDTQTAAPILEDNGEVESEEDYSVPAGSATLKINGAEIGETYENDTANNAIVNALNGAVDYLKTSIPHSGDGQVHIDITVSAGTYEGGLDLSEGSELQTALREAIAKFLGTDQTPDGGTQPASDLEELLFSKADPQ